MSHIGVRPLTTEEFDLVVALDNLAISGTNQAIQKTGATSLANITFPSGGTSNITGLIQAGTNITLGGSGTTISPYVISATVTPQVQTDWTETSSLLPAFLKNHYVTQLGSANVPGTLTATTANVNWLQISDGTNNIVQLTGFNTLEYDDIVIAPILTCVTGGVTVSGIGNIHLNNTATSIRLNAATRDFIILRYDIDLSVSLGSAQYVQVTGNKNSPLPVITSTQVGYGSTSNLLTSTSNFIYDPANFLFKVGFGGNDYFKTDVINSLYDWGDISGGANASTIRIDDLNQQYIFNKIAGSTADDVVTVDTNGVLNRTNIFKSTGGEIIPGVAGTIGSTLVTATPLKVLPVNKVRETLFFRNTSGGADIIYIDYANDPTVASFPVSNGQTISLSRLANTITAQSFRIMCPTASAINPVQYTCWES